MSSHPSPVALESLYAYVLSQQECIDSLLESTQEEFKHLGNDNRWVGLRQVAWDKDLNHLDTTHDVERDQDPIHDSLVPDVVHSKCNVMLKPSVMDTCWAGIDCEKIFIRPFEYEEAEESAISTCRDERVFDAFLVTGQPGIGLSLFHLTVVGFSSFRQGNPSSCFVSSSGVLPSSSPPRCESIPTVPCFSTGEVWRNLVTSTMRVFTYPCGLRTTTAQTVFGRWLIPTAS